MLNLICLPQNETMVFMDIEHILRIIQAVLGILGAAPKVFETIGKAWTWFTQWLEKLDAPVRLDTAITSGNGALQLTDEAPSVLCVNVFDTVSFGLSDSGSVAFS
jgi:hypothetical protein